MGNKFCIAEFKNDLGDVRLKLITENELKPIVEACTKQGWNISNISKYDEVLPFVMSALEWVRCRACNSVDEPNCGNLMYYGSICRDILDFMSQYDIDWQDVQRDGELYICLSIFSQNMNKCILMKGGIDHA